MRVAHLIELIAATAFGLALARAHLLDPALLKLYSESSWSEWLIEGGNCLFAGIALFEGVAVLVERLQNRSGARWGMGRWAWSLSGLFVLFRTADCVAEDVVLSVRTDHALPSVAELVSDLRENFGLQFLGCGVWLFGALWLTTKAAAACESPRLDAREWSGRIFVMATIIAYILLFYIME